MENPPDSARLRDAVLGCILGCAVGDALGLPFEGLSCGRVRKLRPLPLRHRLIFGHGMLSDDTEHLCLTAHALVRSGGSCEPFGRSLAWQLRRWFLSLPPATGLATLRACVKLCIGLPWNYSGVYSAGNGPAMRAPIIGVCFAREPEKAIVLTRISTLITHTDPKAVAGSIAIACAASLAGAGTRIATGDYLKRAQTLMAAGDDASTELMHLLQRAARSVDGGESTTDFAASLGLDRGISGYMYHTVPVVIHAWLANQFDFSGSVAQLIQCGGDTDSTAAIAGAIAGAQCGIEGIPAELVREIADWPRTPSWLRRMADAASTAAESHQSAGPPALPIPFTLARNLLFLPIVLAHGFRRLFPPY